MNKETDNPSLYCQPMQADLIRTYVTYGFGFLKMYQILANCPSIAPCVNDDTVNMTLTEYLRNCKLAPTIHPIFTAAQGLQKKGDKVDFMLQTKEQSDNYYNTLLQIKTDILKNNDIPQEDKNKWMHISFNRDTTTLEYN